MASLGIPVDHDTLNSRPLTARTAYPSSNALPLSEMATSDGTHTGPPSPIKTKGENGVKIHQALTTTPTNETVAEGSAEHIEVRNLSWFRAGLLMIAETVSLGIMSLPYAVAMMGSALGVVVLVLLSLLALYAGYVIGLFKMQHPHVRNMGDAGEVLFRETFRSDGAAKVGKLLFGTMFLAFLVFAIAAHILTFGVMVSTQRPFLKFGRHASYEPC